MPVEIKILAWGAVLGLVHILAAVIAKTAQYGVKWNVWARDDDLPPLKPHVARLARAQVNFFETFPIAAVAMLGVVVAEKTSAATALLGWVWLGCRIVYLFLYWAGIPIVRTIIFAVAVTALVEMLKLLLVG